MDNKIVNFILLGIIILALAVGGYFLWQHYVGKPTVKAPVFQASAGIAVNSLKANDTIASPLKITGSVNGDGWNGFEGQVGSVTLLDNNGKALANTFLKATTEWTALPTSFEVTLDFAGVSGTSGFVVFKNENASGDPVKDKTFIVPIKFK